MDMMSNVVIAWQWLQMATVAQMAILTGNTNYNLAFYEGKVHTMQFYFKYELPRVMSCEHTLKRDEVLTIVKEGQKVFAE